MTRMPQATQPTTQPTAPGAVDLDALPGHYIRRLQQIAVAIFMQETADSGVTPVQYAALQAIANTPSLDQRTLAGAIGFDTSTIAGVIDRLQARGLVERHASSEDRRVRRLTLTDDGTTLLAAVQPAMWRTQQRILEPLPAAEQADFMRMLTRLVEANNELSRAPREG